MDLVSLTNAPTQRFVAERLRRMPAGAVFSVPGWRTRPVEDSMDCWDGVTRVSSAASHPNTEIPLPDTNLVSVKVRINHLKLWSTLSPGSSMSDVK